MQSKIADLNSELEELFIFSDTELYTTKMAEMHKKHIESSGIVGVYKKSLENLKEKIKENELISYEKMRELKTLSDQLNFMKGQRSLKQSPRFFALPESGCPDSLKAFSSELSELSQKVREFVQRVVCEEDEFQSNLKTSMLDLHSKNTQLESKITKLKHEYDEQKQIFLLESKQRKEKTLNSLKLITESSFNTFFEICKTLKSQLREKLIQSREQEHKYPSTTAEFEKTYQKFSALKNLRLRLYTNIKKERSTHFDLREKRRKKQIQLVKIKQELLKLKAECQL